jgi:hypothetical protein
MIISVSRFDLEKDFESELRTQNSGFSLLSLMKAES